MAKEIRKDTLTELVERIAPAATAAHENNATAEFMDPDNRRWFVGCANLDNHAHVLIQAQRGQDIREAYLRTNAINPDAVASAVAELHGALS